MLEYFNNQYPNHFLFSSCQSSSESCVTPGIYAIVGAAATLAGVTRMTVCNQKLIIALVVIIFELTGALSYVLPVMVVVLISKWIADSIEKESIYDAIIISNEYPYLQSEFKPRKFALANEVMTPVHKLKGISSPCKFKEIKDLINSKHIYKGYPILSSKCVVNGYIRRDALIKIHEMIETKTETSRLATRFRFLDFNSSTTDILDSSFSDLVEVPISIHPKTRIEIVVELFMKLGLRYVLVTRNGILLGIITKKDVLKRVI